MEIKKTCTRCNEEKPLNNFCKRKQSKDGLSYICKDCQKAYKEANPEKAKASYQAWKEKCEFQPHIAQRQKDQMKQWRKNHPNRIKMYNELQKEKRRSSKSEYFL